MPGPFVVPVHGDIELPKEVDCVVIGGGIVGASTALELAESGLRVALCEKGGIGQEQSSRNWGWIRISRRDPREIPLMAEALRIWPTLSARTGRDTGYVRAGIVFTCTSDRESEQYANWLHHLKDYQFESRMISSAQLANILPGSNLNASSALYTPADSRAEPQRATSAIAEAARERGAAILTECAVRGLEITNGEVSGVITERGFISCKSVVLAGGAWSSLFCGALGLHLPQLKVMNTVFRTTPIKKGPEHAVWAKNFAMRKCQDGGYTMASLTSSVVDIVPDSIRFIGAFFPALKSWWRSLNFRLGSRFVEEAKMATRWRMDEASPFEYCRVLDPKPSMKHPEITLSNAREAFPCFDNAKIAQRWAGYMDVTPDAIPIISAVDPIPGFYLATGFSGHGFGIGPAAGKLMADIVTGRAATVDPTDFRWSRFSDGSKITLIDSI
ncbi:FAD-binding oxidoreductase [Mesorhizobium australicum]|uniref:NAD(P)/FAD-dependent oxidoreductase n=1 Tax=Mesorhizobium australicum TaxID=536018 RepID=UPI003339B30C